MQVARTCRGMRTKWARMSRPIPGMPRRAGCVYAETEKPNEDGTGRSPDARDFPIVRVGDRGPIVLSAKPLTGCTCLEDCHVHAPLIAPASC
jgi:hypothetical protein